MEYKKRSDAFRAAEKRSKELKGITIVVVETIEAYRLDSHPPSLNSFEHVVGVYKSGSKIPLYLYLINGKIAASKNEKAKEIELKKMADVETPAREHKIVKSSAQKYRALTRKK